MQMSKYEEKSAKFYEFAPKVGSVDIDDTVFQFCDHVQKVEGTYYATAFYEGDQREGSDKNGIVYQQISSAYLAFVPLDLVETLKPKYDDQGQTADMLERLKLTIKDMNSKEYVRRAA